MEVDLRYPIGSFDLPVSPTTLERVSWIAAVSAAPTRLRDAVAGLSERQLDTPYRERGWTVRQVVHHLGESHLVAFTRMKFALTEENPVAKSYDESAWVELPDCVSTPLEVSLTLLQALHARWVYLLEGLSDDQFQRKFRHPTFGLIRVEQQLARTAWHGRHHVAHITALRDRMGWGKN
jgi:uncharacterized damage-inducible protein DinB